MKQQIPTRETAEAILSEGLKLNPGKWGDHSRNVAASAEAIGSRIGLDPDTCYVIGLLHDIGRRYGNLQLAHVYYGWKYMNELGYPLCARICLTHSFAMQKLEGYGGAFDLTEKEINELEQNLQSIVYDDYDRLIQLCDNISGASGIMKIEDRISDIISRYPNYPQEKMELTLQLKDEFERRLGTDIYTVTCDGHTVDRY